MAGDKFDELPEQVGSTRTVSVVYFGTTLRVSPSSEIKGAIVTTGTIGVAAMGGDATTVLARIQNLERRNIPAAWLTTGGAGLDALSLFAAAAATTDRILLGTCITPTWPRHPIVTAQQVQVVANLAPGRFRLGLGPSHRPAMKQMFGVDFKTPLTNLREYVKIVKTLLSEGSIEFDGEHYHAHAQIPKPVENVPVMASALRTGSYEFCGAEADGAISWVSPYTYLKDVALPAMQTGAQRVNRKPPPLIAHVPLSVCDNRGQVRNEARKQLSVYPRLPFYARMFAQAGFPEAGESATWSDRMVDAVVLSGNEEEVGVRLLELFGWGIGEVIVHIITVGDDQQASWDRALDLLAGLVTPN